MCVRRGPMRDRGTELQKLKEQRRAARLALKAKEVADAAITRPSRHDT